MAGKDNIDPLAIVAKLAEEERRFSQSTFLAPVVAGGRVCVRLKGVVYELSVEENFEGWAILQMTEPGKAKVVERPSPSLVGKYLKLFPNIRMVLLEQFNNCWYGLASSTSDTRIQLTGPVPVRLVETASRFQTVNTRFDGAAFWFESVDRRRDPVVARTLSKALIDKVLPADLRCAGAVPQERLAYKMLWMNQFGDEEVSESKRIADALQHSGASLEGFWSPREGETAVRFTVDGRTRVVTVRTFDLTVLSAGICLSGLDRNFDLTSIVSVLRESGAHGYSEYD